jgi:dihydroflavonol-4-reductase
LRRLAPADAPDRLDIVTADLMDPGSFDAPFSGCEYICHVAASVRLTARDPQREIVDVAVAGTDNALRAAARAGTVKRFVLTSSIAAVFDVGARENHVYTEDDWNRDATVADSPYPLAKTRSERRAWEFVADQPFDLVAINPAMVIGPVYSRTHLRSSPSLVRDLLIGKFPAAPRFHFGLVDVRDVARAHAEAMARPEAKGRYILYTEGKWMKDLAGIMRERVPGFPRIPSRTMPDFLMYIAALFDKRLSWSFLRRSLGRASRVDNAKVVRELGLELTPIADSVVATCESLVEGGFVPAPR